MDNMVHNMNVIDTFDRVDMVGNEKRTSTKPILVSAWETSKSGLQPSLLKNTACFPVNALTKVGFSMAALPATLASRSSCRAAGKKTALGRSEARSPEKDIQTWVIPSNTRNATTAAILAITDNRRNLIISNERWGGGFIQPIANKQDCLVKVSVTTVCGN